MLLPDTQVFRKRPPRADARLGRALQSFAELRPGDFVVHHHHAVSRARKHPHGCVERAALIRDREHLLVVVARPEHGN